MTTQYLELLKLKRNRQITKKFSTCRYKKIKQTTSYE